MGAIEVGHCHMWLTLANISACFLFTFPLADINKKTGVIVLIPETDVWMVGYDLPCSGMVESHIIMMSSVSTSLSG